MARDIITDEMVEEEIFRLQASPHVKLARREEAIRNRRRQYMYGLRTMEKRGKELAKQGITLENIEARLFGENMLFRLRFLLHQIPNLRKGDLQKLLPGGCKR